MAFDLKTPAEVRHEVAGRAKDRRLALNISQADLAARSGVSLGSVKRFEKSGLVSFSSLLEISLVLGSLADYENLFASDPAPVSLFSPEPKKRKRSSKRR